MHRKIIEPLINHFENTKELDEQMVDLLKQGESYTTQDKAKMLEEHLDKTKSAELEAEALLHSAVGFASLEDKDYLKGFKDFMTAYDLTNDPHYKGLAFHAEALEYRAKNKLQKAVDKNFLALEYTKEARSKETISKYISLDLNSLSTELRCQESFDEAISKRSAALQLAKDQTIKSDILQELAKDFSTYGHFLATQQDLDTAVLKHLAAYELTNDSNHKADALYTKAGTFIQTKQYALAIFALTAAYDECKTDYCLRPMFHQMITHSRMIQLHEEGHTIDLGTIQKKAKDILKAPKEIFLKFLGITPKNLQDELKKFEQLDSTILEPIEISKSKAEMDIIKTGSEFEDDILDNALDEIFPDLSLNGSDALEGSNVSIHNWRL